MKRVKVKPKSPNPLFEKWLQEWKDEAAAKGSDMQYCFARALASLKKYPLVLDSGKDCIILQNFGAKLCQMLEKKLAEYQKTDHESVVLTDQHNSGTTDDDISGRPSAKKMRNSRKSKAKENVDNQNRRPTSLSTERPYIPTWRSGGYAILMALYNRMLDPDYIGYMSKADLQAEAQPLCDKSLKKPDPGSHYSAWSSMSTLVEKELVTKKGNPAKFSLTDHGMAIAMQLSDLSENDPALTESNLAEKLPKASKHRPTLSKGTNSKVRAPALNHIHSLSPEPDDLIDPEGMAFTVGSSAWNDNVQMFTNSEPFNNLPSCSNYKPTTAKATSTITKPVQTEKSSVQSLSPEPDDVIDLDSRSNSPFLPEFNDFQTEISATSDLTERQIKTKTTETVPTVVRSDAHEPTSMKQKKKSSKISNSEKNIEDSAASSTNSTIVLQPHRFDVILLVDTQETAGKKTKPRDDATIAELTRTKILFEVRHLKIGDFAWIARSRDNKDHELVLPYIVERKRMDDLGGSIKDGRFHEQKFRLKKSGIQNLIYVVESYGNNQHTGLPLATLQQAAVNTSVQDGFTVKHTNNHRDSMLYLASLTTMLTQIYQRKTLVSCKKEDLVPTNVLNDLIPVMDFKEFNKAASKVKNFKVKEMFVRQLLQLKGISVEKALAIVERYPTPKLLVQAYRNTGSSGEKLLANIQFGSLKRHLGPALSKTIYQLYSRRDLG